MLVTLTAAERHRLKKMAHGHKTPHQARYRAQVVLLRGLWTLQRPDRPGDRPHLDTVRTWRDRFAEQGLPGLADRKRSGRPPSFTALQVAEQSPGLTVACRNRHAVVALVVSGTGSRGGRPGRCRVDLRLHCVPLAQGRRPQALAAPVLDLPTRPGLRAKAARVLDLYARTLNGEPLGEDE